MRIYIEADVTPREGESREDAERHMDLALCFGTMKDALVGANIDLQSIAVVSKDELGARVERFLKEV